MNESRAEMKADIIQLLKELNVIKNESDSDSKPIKAEYNISELQFRITSLAGMCRILSSKALETSSEDIKGIEDIQHGIVCVSRELDECAAIAQILDGIY